jgi:rhodanese-related sulfurtransferase
MDSLTLSHLLASDPTVRLLDVRTPGEFESAHVSGAYNVPLDLLPEHAAEIRAAHQHPVVLVCQSGQRARKAEVLLREAGMANLGVLDGGMKAWLDAALPVVRLRARMSLERQVRIAAGSLGAIGAVLALTVHPYFAGVPLVIGSGLVFSGMTDTCGMAMLLARLPYNRPATCDSVEVVRRFLAAQ